MTEQDWKLLLIFAFFPISLLVGLIYLIITMTMVIMYPDQKVIKTLDKKPFIPTPKIPVKPYNPRTAQVQYPISRQKIHHKRLGPITSFFDQNKPSPTVNHRRKSKPDKLRRRAIINARRMLHMGKN